MKKHCVVLLSGGLDSSVNLYEAYNSMVVDLALTFDYGQRAAKKEIQTSVKLCAKLGIPHKTLEVLFFRDFTKTSLVDNSQPVPTGDDVKINEMRTSLETAKKVWVPNRNGILINIAAAYAEGSSADHVVVGFNIEEAQTFPDNTEEFLNAAQGSLFFSTSNHVQMKCFTTRKNKTQIVERALELRMQLSDLWPCYFANDEWCGACESCQRFARAVNSAQKPVVSHEISLG